MTLSKPQYSPDCSCDEAGSAGRLLSLEQALARGLALASAVEEMERLPLALATGRITATAVRTTTPLPQFDNAGMDGYALRLSDMAGNGPWVLPVAGRVAAGDPPAECWPKGSVLRILTGAPVPDGADAVLMQEQADRQEGRVVLHARPRRDENIRRRGEDLQAGAEILPAGIEIGPREAAALAVAGMGEVTVRRQVRVAIFSTGSELREPGEPLAPGQIWNANRYMLRAALDRRWVALTDLGAVPDDAGALSAALRLAAETADMVITTGGVSVGDEDHMPRLVREAGGEIHAMRIAMKPGKPVTLGQLGAAVFAGLPGNPVSAFVTWKVLAAPILERLAGIGRPATRDRLVMPVAEALDRKPGRLEFRPVRLVAPAEGGTRRIAWLAPSYSARVALLAGADGLAVIPPALSHVAAGDYLEVLTF